MSWKTAITRKSVSRPARKWQYMVEGAVLDYGCGKGFDADFFGWDKYDPYFFPGRVVKIYDTVILNYVVNVVRDPRDLIQSAVAHLIPGGLLFLSARPYKDIETNKHKWRAEDGGWITGSGTYQKPYNAEELIKLVGWEDVICFQSNPYAELVVRRPRSVYEYRKICPNKSRIEENGQTQAVYHV